MEVNTSMNVEGTAIIDSIKLFMGRAIATREHIPEFSGIYVGINNQGDILKETKV